MLRRSPCQQCNFIMSLVPRYQDMKYFNFVNVSIPFKTNKPSFCLILKASHALVCSVYHLGININASDEASLNVTSSFRSFIISRNSLIWLLLDIVSSKGFSKHGIQYFFSDIDAAMTSFQVLVNAFCQLQACTALFCLLIVLRALFHLIL